ncbi:MAG: hypothetical protein WCJ64_02975 [Rhodospirillaceae bacterium]
MKRRNAAAIKKATGGYKPGLKPPPYSGPPVRMGSTLSGRRGRSATGDGVSSQKAQVDRAESEDLRVTVIARHRSEWLAVAVLRDESADRRHADLGDATSKAKFAKITAEVVKLQQEGERKAWGLDDMGDFDPSKMTDDQLEAIVRGRT